MSINERVCPLRSVCPPQEEKWSAAGRGAQAEGVCQLSQLIRTLWPRPVCHLLLTTNALPAHALWPHSCSWRRPSCAARPWAWPSTCRCEKTQPLRWTAGFKWQDMPADVAFHLPVEKVVARALARCAHRTDS